MPVCLPCMAAAASAGPPGWALMAATGAGAYALRASKTQRALHPAAAARLPSSTTTGRMHTGTTRALTSAWTDDDFAALASAANRLGMNPADLLLVLASESGLQPWAQYPKDSSEPIAVGLNQLTSVSDGITGLSEAERHALPSKSVAEQLPYVEKFFRGAANAYGIHAFPNATTIYLTNFAPARMSRGSAPETVIYDTSDGAAYTLNKGFDRDGKGTITIGDLTARLSTVATQPTYLEALGRLQAVTGNTRGPNLSAGSGGPSPAKTAILASIAAGGAFFLHAPLLVVVGAPLAVLWYGSRQGKAA